MKQQMFSTQPNYSLLVAASICNTGFPKYSMCNAHIPAVTRYLLVIFVLCVCEGFLLNLLLKILHVFIHKTLIMYP